MTMIERLLMASNNDEANIPMSLKSLSYFIKQVGFPVLAFLLMFYMSFCGLQKMTESMNNQAKVMTELTISLKSFQDQVRVDHSKMQSDLVDIKVNKHGN